MISYIGKKIEAITARQHYKGIVVTDYYKTRKFCIKITEVIKGNKQVGECATFRYDNCDY